jgi:hypothetical protein
MRRLLLGVLLLVLLGGGCGNPPEGETPEKAKTRPRLVRPGESKETGSGKKPVNAPNH